MSQLLAPKLSVRTAIVLAAALTADTERTVAIAPFTGTITGVTYTADAAVTGAAGDTRTLSVLNKTAVVTPATLALVNTVNLVAFTPKVIPVSGTAANVAVTAGDVLTFKSTHAGSTGLADPGGVVAITFSRADPTD